MPFDFAAASTPFRMQPGLRRLALGSQQLTPNDRDSPALRERLDALLHHASQALVAVKHFNQAPALCALMQQATTEHPNDFIWNGASVFESVRLGWRMCDGSLAGDGPAKIGARLRALPPAWRLPELLNLALAEDFAVINGASACIPWLAVCLPSRWAPEDKVGRHFAEVYAPVANNRLLVVAADHLAQLVTGTEPWERFVWSIASDPGLMQHPQHSLPPAWPAALDADTLARCASFRTEHQTFIPVPAERQAVFTIHVDTVPLDSAVRPPRLPASCMTPLRA